MSSDGLNLPTVHPPLLLWKIVMNLMLTPFFTEGFFTYLANTNLWYSLQCNSQNQTP